MTAVPLRLRLTLVFALAMAAVLAGAGGFLYHRLASDLGSALDQELRSRAQDVSALVARGGSLAGTRGSLIEGGESFAELARATGGWSRRAGRLAGGGCSRQQTSPAPAAGPRSSTGRPSRASTSRRAC